MGLIVELLNGELDPNNPNKSNSLVFGKQYRNTVTAMICDKFGAEPEHTREGCILNFISNHLSKIAKICGSGQIKTIPVDCEHVKTVNTVNRGRLLSNNLQNK